MVPFGSDRSRMVAGKVILHSAISKGWTARRPKKGTHSEFPGTAVLWGEQYFEVVEASLIDGGGVRYVLEPWRDELTMRVVDRYDEESERLRLADYELAKTQRRLSVGARFAAMFLGHLPEKVQNRIGNELGIMPVRMTLVSTIPSMVFLGVCAWLSASARLREEPSPISPLLWLVALGLFAESAMRFMVVMTQNRGIGSILGYAGYTLFWLVSPKRANVVSPFEQERGVKVVITDAPADVALRDAIEMRSPLMTLLTPEEQTSLAERYGFDYRRHAKGVAWTILICASLGIASSFARILTDRSFSAVISFAIAAIVVLEQASRLAVLRRGPAGSFLGVLVRPFLRGFLERG